MRGSSLATRLFLSATAWVVVILLLTGIVLSSVYRNATERAFDGAPRDEVVATLEQRDGAALDTSANARRWFTSFGSCSIAEPWADLHELGLVR